MSNWSIQKKTDDLVHYGVLGMKWGVRRYQNKDGSLTSAGRKRYSSNRMTEESQIKLMKSQLGIDGQLQNSYKILGIDKALNKGIENIVKKEVKLFKEKSKEAIDPFSMKILNMETNANDEILIMVDTKDKFGDSLPIQYVIDKNTGNIKYDYVV